MLLKYCTYMNFTEQWDTCSGWHLLKTINETYLTLKKLKSEAKRNFNFQSSELYFTTNSFFLTQNHVLSDRYTSSCSQFACVCISNRQTSNNCKSQVVNTAKLLPL